MNVFLYLDNKIYKISNYLSCQFCSQFHWVKYSHCVKPLNSVRYLYLQTSFLAKLQKVKNRNQTKNNEIDLCYYSITCTIENNIRNNRTQLHNNIIIIKRRKTVVTVTSDYITTSYNNTSKPSDIVGQSL